MICNKKDRATPRCRPIKVKIPRLEENAATNLDDALTAAAAGDLGIGRTVHGGRWSPEVHEVEDIADLATKLELERFVDGKVPEEGTVNVPIARDIKLRRAGVSKQTQRSEARATGIGSGSAIGRRVEPLRHLRNARTLGERVRRLARHNAGTVVARPEK